MVKLLAPVVAMAAITGILIDPLVHATAAPGQSPTDTTWPALLDDALLAPGTGRARHEYDAQSWP